jgi:hypothetical protein
MNTRYTLRVFHADGHYYQDRNCNHLRSDYVGKNARYDTFDSERNPITEIVYWNRIYKMQNGRDPVMPQRIEMWKAGTFTVVDFNPWFFKATNFILKCLPKSIRRYRKNFKYVRFFGM